MTQERELLAIDQAANGEAAVQPQAGRLPPEGRCCELGDRAHGDVELLDAYSRAVTTVVDTVGPAVVSLAMRLAAAERQGNLREGSGSGVVIAPDGYVLTNSHVVRGAASLEAGFMDGTTAGATLVGIDPPTDLAVIRVQASGLAYATLGNSDALRVGQLVIAMGNPLGFQSTVSTGVVSSAGRALRTENGRLIENVIQHTAPLNPGNSGGALVDSRGRLVGVNMAMIAAAQGIGFAIPSNTAQWVVSELITQGRVRRAYLGIACRNRPLPRRLARRHNLETEQAVEIISVVPEGPATRGGLLIGDLIVALNGERTVTVDDLHRFLSRWPIGQAVRLTVLRFTDKLELEAEPIEMPREPER